MELSNYLEKSINGFCHCGYTDPALNHCAHFVSHVLGFSFGMTCRKLTGCGNNPANVRVHEVFRECPRVGQFGSGNSDVPLLVFATDRSNVFLESRTMRNVPKKHIGIFDGMHIYHYSNTREKVIKQSVSEFLQSFRAAYGGDVTLFYGAVPGSNMGVHRAAVTGAAAIRSSNNVEYEIRGNEVYAAVNGSPEFYVGNQVPYHGRRGITQKVQKLYGPTYNPADFFPLYSQWAYLVYAMGAGESKNRFNCINTYDRAAFTFGFFQLAAHTPNDNLVLLLRMATELPSFRSLFPDLQLIDGRLHTVNPQGSTNLEQKYQNSSHNEYNLKNLMAYLNADQTQVDEREIINAAKLIYLSNTDEEFRALQVRAAVQITVRKFRERYNSWYGLDRMSDALCFIIADIHHQGRGTKTQVRNALASTDPLQSLLRIGEDNYPDRCQTLQSAITQLMSGGILDTHYYDGNDKTH